MSGKAGIAWLSVTALNAMSKEAELKSPLETGGVLIGYPAPIANGVVILKAVGPGPNAIHEPCAFTPDNEFHKEFIASVYKHSGRRLSYLGDWHSHPGGGASLSTLDRKTLTKIACFPQARAPRPLMAILAPGPVWSPSVWQARFETRIFRAPKLEVRLLNLIVIEQPTEFA